MLVGYTQLLLRKTDMLLTKQKASVMTGTEKFLMVSL